MEIVYSHLWGSTALLIIATSYFIPSIIAFARQHNNKLPILVLNFFLGWSFFGWVVALIWSLTNNTAKI